MSSAQDPFYIVKDEIQESSTFHQWEHIPVASGEQSHLTKELLSNCDNIDWQEGRHYQYVLAAQRLAKEHRITDNENFY
uniref:Syntaxin-61-like n=1 Tax=Tanacetum cinerariifolium TaxID=118510 RepID=A0A699HXK6_TANCI|nr:syntaxin-61-like [Tanacetum cinerariifolium]